MPSRKRKHDEVQGDGDSALKGEDGSEPNFQVVINPPKSYASNYASDFGSRLNLKYAVLLRGSTIVWNRLKNYKSFQGELFLDVVALVWPSTSCDVGRIERSPAYFQTRPALNSKTLIPVNSFVYVRGNPSANKGIAKRGSSKSVMTPDEEVEYENWVAQVLECKAADSRNVFLRVIWFYWPDDLQGYGGRRDYHGDLEVIPSNHMQIINAITVGGLVELEKWDDRRDANHASRADCLIWRHTLDVYTVKRSGALHPLPVLHCICEQPANPNRFLFRCSACRRWMHEECIIKNAISEVASTELQRQSPNKASDGEELIFANDHGDASAAALVSTETPSSILSRMYDRLVPKRDTASPAPKTSIVSTAQSRLRAEKGENHGQRDNTTSSDKDDKFAVEGVASSPQPQRKLTIGKVGTAKQSATGGKEVVTAKVKDPSPEEVDRAITIILLTKRTKDGEEQKWEQPLYCLFKDCGKITSKEENDSAPS